RFGAEKNFPNAVKLSAYSHTPLWLAGIFLLIPGLNFLLILGLYGFYLLWVGLPMLMKVGNDKALPYAAIVTACALIPAIVLTMIQRRILLPRGGRHAAALTLGAAHDVHQLFDLSPLIGLVAGGDRMLDAMGDVIAQDLLLEAPQRRAHRRNLRHDVDAVAIRIDHARDAAHLAFDPAQALGAGRLDVSPHARYIPPQGIRFNP